VPIIDVSGLEGGFDEIGLAEFVKVHQGARLTGT
jgi:hypothetical protein